MNWILSVHILKKKSKQNSVLGKEVRTVGLLGPFRGPT